MAGGRLPGLLFILREYRGHGSRHPPGTSLSRHGTLSRCGRQRDRPGAARAPGLLHPPRAAPSLLPALSRHGAPRRDWGP